VVLALLSTTTLSKVAVATVEVEFEVTANPTNTLVAMEIVCVVPCWTQVAPSSERYPLKLLPERTSLNQYGADTAPPVLEVLLPFVLDRYWNMSAPSLNPMKALAEPAVVCDSRIVTPTLPPTPMKLATLAMIVPLPFSD